MKKLMVLIVLIIASVTVKAQYNDDYDYREYNDDRYFYDDEFDWHWDIRVRISNGIDNGLITGYESQKLYSELERIERKEYAYQQDGYYTDWEQQDVWNDVIYLNRRLGIELSDRDRVYYGFDRMGISRRGFSIWFYSGGYDFYRFDRLGFGSISLGYRPRPNFIRRHIYVHRHPVYRDKARAHFYGGSRGRVNNGRSYSDNRGRNSYPNGNPRGLERGRSNSSGRGTISPNSQNNPGRNSRGSYGSSARPDKIEKPRSENQNGNSRGSYGSSSSPSRVESSGNSSRGSSKETYGNRDAAPRKIETPKAMPGNEKGASTRQTPSNPGVSRGSSGTRARESAPQQRQGSSNEKRSGSDEGRGRSGRRS